MAEKGVYTTFAPCPKGIRKEAESEPAMKARRRANDMKSNFELGGRSEPARRYPMMRLSMFYLAGYLLPVGFLLMFAPQLTMKLLLTNHTYDDLGLRMGGVFLFAIGMIIVSMIINQASAMYLTTLFVRPSLRSRCSCSMESIVIQLCLRLASL
jgi:uncharacterized protein YjeT (DUF2065 family)